MKPMIEFSGVRSSWLMVARNSDLSRSSSWSRSLASARSRVRSCHLDLQPVARLAQGGLGLAALPDLEAQGHEIGHRAGEALFVGRPLARRPGVLMADHTDELSFAADRRIEHGGDPELR